jgi:uncharacterized protein (DUF1501 family)
VKSTEDGWMNRCLQAKPAPDASPLRAVAMTKALPRSLAGSASAVAVASLRDFGFRDATDPGVAGRFEEMYSGAADARLRDTGRDAFEAMEIVERVARRRAPGGGDGYPRGPLGDALRQAAQLLKADVGVESVFAETGGWDHHAAQGGVDGQHANRLRELGAALAAFHRDLGSRMQEVVVVTLTEFGRTVRENGNRGTDHGHASAAFVLGGAVRGGRVHGRWPGLGRDALHEGRDLAVTTDFRDLVGELVARHLGVADLVRVFPGHDVSPARFPGVLRSQV